MGDVSVEPYPAISIALGTIFAKPTATLVAEASSKMILGAALRAPVGELPARHGDKQFSLRASDDFHVADDKGFV